MSSPATRFISLRNNATLYYQSEMIKNAQRWVSAPKVPQQKGRNSELLSQKLSLRWIQANSRALTYTPSLVNFYTLAVFGQGTRAYSQRARLGLPFACSFLDFLWEQRGSRVSRLIENFILTHFDGIFILKRTSAAVRDTQKGVRERIVASPKEEHRRSEESRGRHRNSNWLYAFPGIEKYNCRILGAAAA